MKNKFLAFLLCAAVMLSLTVCASADANIIIGDNNTQIIGDNNTVIFADVPSSFWAKDEIESFYQQGIVNGYADGSFHPSDGVRRAEFCKMLALAFQNELPTPEAQAFSDVPSAHWAYAYVDLCKDFMTGYANPFGGLPAFHPNEYATREDIAVALVKMMGLSKSDTSNANLAAVQFTDGDGISPNLVPYVSIAYERGLISGYPDGTFRPTKGITRAETVVLLNRVSKQAMADIDKEVRLDCVGCFDEDGKTYRITIFTDGNEATVNGTPIDLRRVIMPSTSTDTSRYPAGYIENGIYPSYYEYVFEQEGTQTFTVVATNGKKSKTETLTAEYKIDGPTLNVTSCPTRTDQDTATIAGVVSDSKDANERINLTINGESVTVYWDGAWSQKVSLREGENTFTIVATNTRGASTTVMKTIRFDVDAPTLSVTSCPTKTNKKTAKIAGNVFDNNDANDRIHLTINGESVKVYWDGAWSKDVSLQEGENAFEIIATNTHGKSAKATRAIQFEVDAPKLNLTICPTKTDETKVSIAGYVSDTNDANERIHLTINGESVTVYWDGAWSKNVSLKKGENTFTIVATNSFGKSATVTKTIIYPSSYVAPTQQTHTHDFGSWITDKEANCGEAGSKHRVCSTCGYTETAQIATTDHSFTNWVVEKEATETTAGLKSRQCSSCGKKETQTIPVVSTPLSQTGTAFLGNNAVAQYSWSRIVSGSGKTVKVEVYFEYFGDGGTQHDSIQAEAKVIYKSGNTTKTEIVRGTIPANKSKSETTTVQFAASDDVSISVTKA